jgi:heptosyltransferase-2
VSKEKIAVILPNHLGDLAMATPALRSLRRGRPGAEITGVVREGLEGLLQGCTWLDHFLVHRIYRRPARLGRLVERARVAGRLRGVDLVVVLPNSWSGALLALLCGAPGRVGYARRGRAVLLSERVPAPRQGGRFQPIAMERYYLDLVVRGLGCPDHGTQIELPLDSESERECDRLFAAHGIHTAAPLVGLAPGAGFGPSKLWPPAHFARTARALLDEGVQVALLHGPGEEPLAHEIRLRTGPGVLSLGGDAMTLGLLKSVVARSQLLVCNDSGARHIAAAFEVPALVLFGPTSIRYTNLNLKKTRILREAVECSPCQLRVCPIDHRCMTRLLPERVVAEARQALRDPAWQGSLELEHPA